MSSSSFCAFPGLQILHSTDLVNWELIGVALRDYPDFSTPQHGNGVWAPAIRYHNGEFYIYCGDPDRGIFMVKTKDPAGVWEKPVWVLEAKGKSLIQPGRIVFDGHRTQPTIEGTKFYKFRGHYYIFYPAGGWLRIDWVEVTD